MPDPTPTMEDVIARLEAAVRKFPDGDINWPAGLWNMWLATYLRLVADAIALRACQVAQQAEGAL